MANPHYSPKCNLLVWRWGFLVYFFALVFHEQWGVFVILKGNGLKRVVLIVVIAVGLLGCRGKDADPGDSAGKELVFYCAAGIRPPVADIIDAFQQSHDTRIITDYAGSEVLLSKIKLIQSGDLYMPGDKHYIAQADDAGMIETSVPVFYWVPTILVRKGNPKKIAGLHDLLGDGLKVGLGDPKACAIGRKTKQLLEKNGISWPDIEKNLKFQSQTVNELGMQIHAGALDAVIVWDAIARYYDDHGELIPIAAEKNIVSSVDIGILKFSKKKADAQTFVDFMTSNAGRLIFEKHNYTTKPTE